MISKSIIALMFVVIVYLLRKVVNWVERGCLFQNVRCPSSVKVKGDDVQEVNIGKVNALYYKNPVRDDRIVMYLHGNSGHIHQRYSILNRFKPYASFIMFDYSGYGKTPGKPTELGVKKDAMKVWRWLIDSKGYTPDQIVVYGNSLGSSIATWLVSVLDKEKPRQLVIQAGFCNYREIVGDLMHPLISYLCTISFDTASYLESIGDRVPVLIVHSPDDKLINIRHSKHLREKNPHAKFYQITGTHNNPGLDNKYFEYFCNECL